MVSVSLCMVVRNGENWIGRCLESIKDSVDEMNIVDVRSTDKTKEIISLYTDRVFDWNETENITSAKNFCLQQATMDYILWFEADDVFFEEAQQKFSQLKENLDPSTDGVAMDYQLLTLSGEVALSLKTVRLVKRMEKLRWVGDLLPVHGNLIHTDIVISRLEEEIDTKTSRHLYDYANQLANTQDYQQAIDYYIQSLETNEGNLGERFETCMRIADCYKQLGNSDKELDWVLQTFKYDTPQPATCCRLGGYFLNLEQYDQGIYWYKQALENESDKVTESEAWIPHLWLCVCYDRLGQYELAYYHNEEARRLNPQEASIIENKKYFESLLFPNDAINSQNASRDCC